MNKFFFFALALLLCSACGSHTGGYVIRGSFPGLKDGMTVTLRNVENENYKILATDTVRDGKFELRGVVSTPRYCGLVIDNRSCVSSPEEVRSFNTFLFLDNSELTLKAAHLDSMRFIPLFMSTSADLKIRVESGPLQREFYEYRAALLPLRLAVERMADSLGNLGLYEDQYTLEEFNRKFDVFYPQRQAAEAAVDAANIEFVRRHPQSPLSLYIAEELLKTTFVRTPDEVEELVHIAGQIDDTVRRPYVLRIAEVSRTLCKGGMYKDVELTTAAGDTVKLSQYVHPDRYTLVDFWASWCGACRWAIPKVEQLYQRYDCERLTLLSVSLDQKREAWEKAMKEEAMPWAQAWAGSSRQVYEIQRAYNITGIPRLLLIAPDGRIAFSGNSADALRFTMEKLLGK